MAAPRRALDRFQKHGRTREWGETLAGESSGRQLGDSPLFQHRDGQRVERQRAMPASGLGVGLSTTSLFIAVRAPHPPLDFSQEGRRLLLGKGEVPSLPVATSIWCSVMSTDLLLASEARHARRRVTSRSGHRPRRAAEPLEETPNRAPDRRACDRTSSRNAPGLPYARSNHPRSPRRTNQERRWPYPKTRRAARRATPG